MRYWDWYCVVWYRMLLLRIDTEKFINTIYRLRTAWHGRGTYERPPGCTTMKTQQLAERGMCVAQENDECNGPVGGRKGKACSERQTCS